MGTILSSPPVRLCSNHACQQMNTYGVGPFSCQQPVCFLCGFGIVRGPLPYRPKWVSDGILKDGNPDQLAKAMLEQQFGNVFSAVRGFDDEEQSKGWLVVMVSGERLSPVGISATAGIVVIRFDFGQQGLELFGSTIQLNKEGDLSAMTIMKDNISIGSDGYLAVMTKGMESKQGWPGTKPLKMMAGLIADRDCKGSADIHQFQFMQESGVFDIWAVTHGLPGSNWVLPQKSCLAQGKVSFLGQIEGNTGIWLSSGTLCDIPGILQPANPLPCRTLITIKVDVAKLRPGHEAHLKKSLKDIQVTWLKDKLAWGKGHMGNIVSCCDTGLCLYRWGYQTKQYINRCREAVTVWVWVILGLVEPRFRNGGSSPMRQVQGYGQGEKDLSKI